MPYRDTRKAYRTLAAVAGDQGGYFTAKQAREAGYDYPHLKYHLTCGNFERVAHGLYRLPDLPASEHDDLIRFTLWSRDRSDEPQAVVSHQTALALHELSDVIPTETHLSVPPSFRKPTPKGVVLHRARLSPTDIEEHDAIRVTTPLRSILDVAEGDLPRELLEQAVAEAIDRGMVRRAKLQAAVAERPNSRLSLLSILHHNRRK